MKKGLYIHSGSKTRFTGVDNKIKDQINALSRLYDVREIVIEKEQSGLLGSVMWRLPGGSWGRDYDNALSEIKSEERDSISFIYLRNQASDRRYLGFIRDLRSKCPNAKIILEFPTYPYSRELLGSRTMWPWFFKDMAHRGELKRYVDVAVTYTPDVEIFGIPAIRIINGIDTKRITPITTERAEGDATIRIVAVAQFQPSHGYERFIWGLNRFYKDGGTRNIELHMVGDGAELPRYKEIVKSCGLGDRVIFYGIMYGSDLDRVYENMDAGLAGLGLYKRGIKRSSALKVREYLAKGLPVITGAPNDAFLFGGKEYCLEVGNHPGEVDIGRVLSWYDILTGEHEGRLGLAGQIRDFAEKTVDVASTMNPIIEYLEKDNG